MKPEPKEDFSMTMQDNAKTQDNGRDLVLTRLIDAPAEKIYAAWTQPELLTQWFAPKPWSTPRAVLDVRVGGASVVTMADENGTEYPNPGQYLEVVPNEKLVFTDAYVGDWEPSGKPFMTVIITLTPEGGKTRYTALARHWTEEDRKTHEQMGFHDGWGICADQMEALLARI
jgi:uncharacterized protein YndB with AHSA1/START domain